MYYVSKFFLLSKCQGNEKNAMWKAYHSSLIKPSETCYSNSDKYIDCFTSTQSSSLSVIN